MTVSHIAQPTGADQATIVRLQVVVVHTQWYNSDIHNVVIYCIISSCCCESLGGALHIHHIKANCCSTTVHMY